MAAGVHVRLARARRHGHGAVARDGAAPHGRARASVLRRHASACARRRGRRSPRRSECAELFAFEPEALTSAGAEQAQRVRALDRPHRRVLLAQAALVAASRDRGAVSTSTRLQTCARCVRTRGRRGARRCRERTETGCCRRDHADLRTPLAALGAASRAWRRRRFGSTASSRCARRSSNGWKRCSGRRGPHEQRIPARSSARRGRCAAAALGVVIGERVRDQSRHHDRTRARSAVDRPQHR